MGYGFNGPLWLVHMCLLGAFLVAVHSREWTPAAIFLAAVAIIEAMERLTPPKQGR